MPDGRQGAAVLYGRGTYELCFNQKQTNGNVAKAATLTPALSLWEGKGAKDLPHPNPPLGRGRESFTVTPYAKNHGARNGHPTRNPSKS